MYAFPAYAILIGLAGIGVAFYQWWSSDKVAMRAMRAREVTPEEAPELHGMIDRLCAMADMPKPRVGVADLDIPNAFATGRSPERAVVCVTTGILGKLTAEELEAVLAHELSHVAHRDVLVMTLASSAGIVAGMLTRGAAWGGFGAVRPAQQQRGAPAILVAVVVSLVVYAISFFLLRLLSRYRELSADRAGAYLTMRPAGARPGAAEDHRRDGRHPAARPARQPGDERLLHRARHLRRHAEDADRPPTPRSSSGWSSWPGSRPSWPGPSRLTWWGSGTRSPAGRGSRRTTSTRSSPCPTQPSPSRPRPG